MYDDSAVTALDEAVVDTAADLGVPLSGEGRQSARASRPARREGRAATRLHTKGQGRPPGRRREHGGLSVAPAGPRSIARIPTRTGCGCSAGTPVPESHAREDGLCRSHHARALETTRQPRQHKNEAPFARAASRPGHPSSTPRVAVRVGFRLGAFLILIGGALADRAFDGDSTRRRRGRGAGAVPSSTFAK